MWMQEMLFLHLKICQTPGIQEQNQTATESQKLATPVTSFLLLLAQSDKDSRV